MCTAYPLWFLVVDVARRPAATGDVVPPGFVLPEIKVRGFE
jgi:hypothetical protein